MLSCQAAIYLVTRNIGSLPGKGLLSLRPCISHSTACPVENKLRGVVIPVGAQGASRVVRFGLEYSVVDNADNILTVPTTTVAINYDVSGSAAGQVYVVDPMFTLAEADPSNPLVSDKYLFGRLFRDTTNVADTAAGDIGFAGFTAYQV